MPILKNMHGLRIYKKSTYIQFKAKQEWINLAWGGGDISIFNKTPAQAFTLT
jgi:hypothetical protein